MIISNTNLKDAVIIEMEKHQDNRGFFGRVWDEKIFKEKGLTTKIAQCSVSSNLKKGTLRGMHFQEKPFQEVKIVSCRKGCIFDVIIDLRPDSKTYKQWYGIELKSDEHKSIYIPKGFAHGFQSLEDNTEVYYQISEFYNPAYSNGIRWDDPVFGIKWPLNNPIISEKDLVWNAFVG
jgi:dTDP-4-dehydrorhamnose 3,5-epimerase